VFLLSGTSEKEALKATLAQKDADAERLRQELAELKAQKNVAADRRLPSDHAEALAELPSERPSEEIKKESSSVEEIEKESSSAETKEACCGPSALSLEELDKANTLLTEGRRSQFLNLC